MMQQVQLEKSEKIISKDRGGLRLLEINKVEILVSVVCVTLNAARTLPDLIKSVRDHKTEKVEFVVIDGNSTDGTVDVLKESEDVIDFWVSKPDDGIYDAMNRAVNYVRGKWIIFLGADDHLLDGFSGMINLLKDPNTIYYGNLFFYGKEFLKVYDDYYLTKLNICHQAIFYPKTVFNKYNYDLQYNVYADYHLNLRCWNDPRFKFVHGDYFVSYFQSGGFSTFTKDSVFESDKDILFKTYLKPASYYRYLNRTVGFFGMFIRFIQNSCRFIMNGYSKQELI